MPKRKTSYIVIHANPNVGGNADMFGVVGWDIEAWNAGHAARLVRADPDRGIFPHEKLAVVPSRFFSEH